MPGFFSSYYVDEETGELVEYDRRENYPLDEDGNIKWGCMECIRFVDGEYPECMEDCEYE